jgi:hypothetical protein
MQLTRTPTAPPQQRGDKICSRSRRLLTLLCKGNGQHTPPCTQRNCHQTSKAKDYCALQEEAVLAYKASKMILAVHSDVGYCNKKKLQSRAGGHFFLSNDNEFPPNGGAILTMATMIKAVMSSAVEAKLGELYLNAKVAVYLRQILTKMGHPQPQTLIQADNSTAEGVINHKIEPKQTKAIDMRFHWLHNREPQGQF